MEDRDETFIWFKVYTIFVWLAVLGFIALFVGGNLYPAIEWLIRSYF